MGLFSGCYNDLKAVPESAVEFCQNPMMFIDGIQMIAGNISDPEFIDAMVNSMADSVKQQQELENPYDPITEATLHNAFETGWYSGYIATELLQMVAGGAVFKSVTTSAEFTQLATRVMGAINDVKTALKASKMFATTGRVGMTAKVGAMLVLVYTSSSFVADDAAKVVSKVETAVHQSRAVRYTSTISYEIRSQIPQYLDEVGVFVGKQGAVAVNFIEETGAGYMTILANYKIPAKVLDQLSASGARITAVENAAYGPIARVLKDGITTRVKFVEPGFKTSFIEHVSDDIVVDDYWQLVKSTAIRNGWSEEQAINQIGSLDAYRITHKQNMLRAQDELGEGIARYDLKQRGYSPLGADQGFYKTNPYQNGIDHIYIDENNNFVIVESKCKYDGGNVGKGKLKYNPNNRMREMDDEWIRTRIDNMERDNLISSDLASQLRAARTNGQIRKEFYFSQNRAATGKTVINSLMEDDLRIDTVHIYKLGE